MLAAAEGGRGLLLRRYASRAHGRRPPGCCVQLPLFDRRVYIPTHGRRRARGPSVEVTGRIDYVSPRALADRGVYTPATRRPGALAESDPASACAAGQGGYIEGLPGAGAVGHRAEHARRQCLRPGVPSRAATRSGGAELAFTRAPGSSLAESFEGPTPRVRGSAFAVGAALARGSQEPLACRCSPRARTVLTGLWRLLAARQRARPAGAPRRIVDGGAAPSTPSDPKACAPAGRGRWRTGPRR